MNELMNVRCSRGRLIITETAIIVEMKFLGIATRTETLFRESLLGIDKSGGVPSVFGHGGGSHLKFLAAGQTLDAGLVAPMKDVVKIEKLLTGR